MADNKINLPKTNFSMKANLAQKEPQFVKDWDVKDIYNKILNKNKDNKHFILHDGPPYANGHIHLGHALNKVLKDIILKYESMNKKFAPYVPGWDCHGLPIEYQLLKEMDTDKNSVDQLKFRQKAAKFALKHVGIQKEEFKRLGIFGEWDKPYLTLSPGYEAKIVEIFGELYDKGYIYRGKKPVYWCASCETALAEAEVEYKDHTSPSVYVKFPMLNKTKTDTDTDTNTDTSILIWTTTPWTLPANMAVAFNSKFDYVIVEVLKSENKNIKKNEKFVLAKSLLDKVFEKIGVKDYKIVENLKGKSLEGIKCQSPYRKESSVGILADFVKLEDGTGIVHIAPGHGDDDYNVGLKYKLEIYNPVNSSGKFMASVGHFEDEHIFKANPKIVNNLDQRYLLLAKEDIDHSYPHCWRCKSPVIFRATDQWFLNVDNNDLRSKILKICENVNWIPEYGFKRITSMIENRPDWCLSRQRLWGTPVPVFYCEKCGKEYITKESIKAIKNMFKEKGSDAWFYKSIEDFGIDLKCDCGSTNFKKETDILDVWFDSGVSHEAVLKERDNLSWPADLYLEGSDQHRGWFQSSIIPAVALHSKAPYKSVLTHGFTVDGDGRKMSKSQGNVISPHDITNKFGADVLRLWIASENYRNDMPISDEIIKQMTDAYRKIRNTMRYILGNLDGFDFSKDEVKYEDLLELDKWALSELAIVSERILTSYENREFHSVYREFYNFCTIELSSRYFDILKDRLYVYSPKSLERRSAQTVLYYLAISLTKFMVPIMPFTAEEIWNNFENNQARKESVLLENLPVIKKEWFGASDLTEKWNNIFEFRNILLKRIEEKRLDGILGNSLEAKVLIGLEKECPELDLVEGFEEFWTKIAIVSQLEISMGEVDQNNIVDFDVDNKISVRVEKASGKKCERCWNYADDIGQNTDYPEYCSRCVSILENW